MTDNTERGQVGWRFWLWWVFASSAGLAVPLFTAFGEGMTVDVIVRRGALVGASVGIAQWLVLRRLKISRASLWVWLSIAGMVVGAVVIDMVFGAMSWAPVLAVGEDVIVGAVIVDEVVGTVVGLALFGASIGTAQGLVLRSWHVPQTTLWVLANIMAMIVGGAMVGVASDMALSVALVVPVVGYGAITGGVLVWLLRQPATIT